MKKIRQKKYHEGECEFYEGVCEHCLIARIDEVVARKKELETLYYELVNEVSSKYPNETRHETTLRYIRERDCEGEVLRVEYKKEDK